MRPSRITVLLAVSLATIPLAGCKARWEKAYEACKAERTAETPEGDGAADQIARGLTEVVNAVGGVTCEPIRVACESDSESDTCKALVDAFLEGK